MRTAQRRIIKSPTQLSNTGTLIAYSPRTSVLLVSLIMNYTTTTSPSVSVLQHEVSHSRLDMTPPATT